MHAADDANGAFPAAPANPPNEPDGTKTNLPEIAGSKIGKEDSTAT